MSVYPIGYIDPAIYDGISVWIDAPGAYRNRWDPEQQPDRWRAAQDLIDQWTSQPDTIPEGATP